MLASDGSIAREDTSAKAVDIYALAQHLAGDLTSSGLNQGISVALLDDSMFADNKIMCFLIESTPLLRQAIKLQQEGYSQLNTLLEPEIQRAASAGSNDSLPSLSQGVEELTLLPAEQIAVLAASNEQAVLEHRIALVLQSLLLQALPLRQRALKTGTTNLDRTAQDFLSSAFDLASQYLATSDLKAADSARVDLLDPRLFAFTLSNLPVVLGSLPSPIQDRLQQICQSIGISGLPAAASLSSNGDDSAQGFRERLLSYQPTAELSLPEVPTSSRAAPISEPTTFLPRITAESETTQLQKVSALTQYRKSTKEKAIRDAHGRIMGRQQAKRFRADQLYSRSVTAYAQSLLGSAGLVRQVITEGGGFYLAAEDEEKKAKQQQPKQKEKKLSKKEQIIQQNQAKQAGKASAQVERKLTYLLEELDIGNATSKFEGADRVMLADRRRSLQALTPYIASAGSAEAGRDLRLLRVRLTVEGWVAACTIGIKEECYDLAVTALTDIGLILAATPEDKFNDHERALLCSCGQALRVMGLQGIYGPAHAGLGKVWEEVEDKKGKPKKGEFPFDVNWPKASKKYTVGDALEFQLQQCGDVMERQLDSKADRRVATFKPDGWQRKVLDAIDARDSLLVVAPTSAGKTFIAFYCIEKALRESSDAVVVYVAPSKALVNQIAAELEARYQKNYVSADRTIWAISTGDFDIHNPLKSQVVVAAPESLHKMTLQSDVAGSWLPRVKAIIMDEIHSLTDVDLGPLWQQLLALVPCPIVALSATIGNVDEFGEWLGKVRAQQGQKLTVVQHGTRYSDLKKHVYLPLEGPAAAPSKTKGVEAVQPVFTGISKQQLDGPKMFKHLHPFTALRPAGSSMPSDLEMTPAEQLQLIRAMQKTASEDKGYALEDKLDPSEFFSDVIGPLKRADTLKYQQALREAVKAWMSRPDSREPGSPFIKLIDMLEGGLPVAIEKVNQDWQATMSHIDFHRENLLPLLSGLHQGNLLPALLFNFSRDNVEHLGQHLVEQLTKGEERYKATNKHWKTKLEEWNKWKDDEPARRKAEEKKLKGIKGKEEADAIKKDARATDAGWQASFDPDAPLPDFTFANEKCGLALEDIIPEVQRLRVDDWMKDGLIRGVAIHHVSLPNNYRQTVERWFRKGWLRVVICTASLALGINMPAKSSVFVGDHIELNSLQYRQAAGRAGRRGMDLAGNVIFYGLPLSKVHRLLTSRLPALDCDYPSSATLNLRLHALMADPTSTQVGQKMTQSVIGLPNPPARSHELPLNHQFRASVEFLRRFGTLSADGQPLALSGFVSQLALNEPSNLAFLELLRSGYLYSITAFAQVDRISAVEEMVTVLSHLFAARKSNPTKPYDAAHPDLPSLSEKARSTLEKLNQQSKAAYLDYAKTIASAQEGEVEQVLPLSKTKIGSSESLGGVFDQQQIHHKIRSAFAAVAGVSDNLSDTTWESMKTVRPGLGLTPSITPSFEHILSKSPKNAYILDFFRHGNLTYLVTQNGLPGATLAWALLNDFWHVLLSLRASLEVLLRAGSRGRGANGPASSEVGSLDADDWADDAEDGAYGDDDLGGEDETDDRRTDSGIAGSQMSTAGGGGKPAPPPGAIFQGVEVRTRSGKRVEPIRPPIELRADRKHPQLWAVYEMLVDIQRTYHARFFKTFA